MYTKASIDDFSMQEKLANLLFGYFTHEGNFECGRQGGLGGIMGFIARNREVYQTDIFAIFPHASEVIGFGRRLSKVHILI